jgi:hypothetical protein
VLAITARGTKVDWVGRMAHTPSRKAGATLIAAIFYFQLLSALGPRPAAARVDPLNRIVVQIQKPNMLVVLDTSGSLTGVPGDVFDVVTDEVGVDCDDGIDCRGGLSSGTCTISGKGCYSDAQCTSSTCQKGYAACASDSDCMPNAGTCATGQACYTATDCPAQTSGHCALNNNTCSPTNKCTVTNKCKYGNVTCATSSDCRSGMCANNTTACNTDNDCPYKKTGGDCSFEPTPAGGCSDASATGMTSSNSNCPVQTTKVCSDNATRSCTLVADCGKWCTSNHNACTSSSQCQYYESCSTSGKSCNTQSNICTFDHTTCTTLYTDNICKDTNPCVPNPNPCNGVTVNSCLPGAAGDTCNATTTTTGSRMCRRGQTKCTSNSNCTAFTGDKCGPATSRLVMAKRVIRNIVNANANIVNLGLMTFYQTGYYPYYTVSGTSTTTTSTLISEGTLSAYGCYSRSAGLSSTCTLNGKTYTLHGGSNARYTIDDHDDYHDGDGHDGYSRDGDGRGSRDVTAAYCGYFCSIPNQGTGVFTAAYYDSSNVTGTTGGTKTVFPTYRGKVFTEAGVTYRYYDSKPDNYSNGLTPPISVANCGSSCSTACGGRWDTQLAPFINSNPTPADTNAVVTAFNQAMEPVGEGGLFANLGTPSGCTLENNGAADKNHSAYHYMQDVKAADTLSCRLNYVLFVTDGAANGPGDDNCTSSSCSAGNPQSAGCQCKAVLAAYHMRQNLGVKTFVVGFSSDATAGDGHTIADNIAKAGGTDVGGDGHAPYSFSATNEKELGSAIQSVIYQAVSGSYSTSPATASQGTIDGTTERSGTILLDARVDFPTWKGHLVAYDMTTGSPQLIWDAATRLTNMDWKKRKVYTRDASDNLTLISIDQTTGAILNKSALNAAGLGESPDEADRIARWALGDPTLKNPAILGSIINSTPIDVGPPADGTAPRQHRFYLDHQTRPSIIYVGSDDGMLHAFFTRNVTVNGVAYTAGNEAFAYLPRSMLGTLTNVFAQNGQVADPAKHIFGLASSPKVKNLCVANCDDEATAVWKTTLVMTEGWGGNGMFMLDITDPVPASGPPINVMWSAASTSQATTYGNDLGSTVSVPAYTFVPGTNSDDQRVIMVSGYPVDTTSTIQGRMLVSSSVQNGTIKTERTIVPGGTACTQEYALLTDVATSRRQLKDANGLFVGRKELLGAYFGDTWGNLWRYSAATDSAAKIASFGCPHPLHFSPTVVQLDADDPSNPFAGQIFLAQVTNSSLDPVTGGYAASKMVIMKETFTTGGPQLDTTFGTGGQIVLSSASTSQMCAVTNLAGTSCTTPLPANARPLATPTGIIKPDGTGFVLLSNWYVPANACVKGKTYLLVHDFSGSSVTLKQASKVGPDEPVLNPIIVNGALMVSASTGPINITAGLTLKVENAIEPLQNVGDVFQMNGWTEIQ